MHIIILLGIVACSRGRERSYDMCSLNDRPNHLESRMRTDNDST